MGFLVCTDMEACEDPRKSQLEILSFFETGKHACTLPKGHFPTANIAAIRAELYIFPIFALASF